MQLQVNPHFVINCLNIIHNLAAMQKTELIQSMAELLGTHLRYTLHGVSTTSLAKEIEHVDNYVRLQQLRFPGCLTYTRQLDESLLPAAVPPLCIQTFVENTVKYQLTAGESVELSILAQSATHNGRACLHIRVTDNGDGYPLEVLLAINKKRKFVDETGEHIGIYNLMQRLTLLFGEEAGLQLSNNVSTGGAQADITIPLEAYGEQKGAGHANQPVDR